MEYTATITKGLIESAKEGDQDSFGEIYETFIAPVFRYVLFRVADEDNAEKLTEEIFLKMWKDLRKFRTEGKMGFHVWTFQVAQKVTHSYLKSLKKTSAARKEFLHKKALEQDLSPELQQHVELQQAFSELPDSQAEAIILKNFCGLTTAEIAFLLEKTEGAVRILQSRGLKRLREIIEGEE